MSRLARKYKKHKRSSGVPRKNPSAGMLAELGNEILPALAGFAGSRLVTRMLTIAINKKWPKAAKHAGAVSAIATFAAAWWGAHKVKFLEKYADSITVGAGIGAAATLLQTYVPKLGWVMSEVATTELAPPAPTPTGEYADSDDSWGVYNDAFDGGRYSSSPAEVRNASAPQEAQADLRQSSEDAIDRFMSTLAAENQVIGGGGIFSGGN